MPRYKLTIEYDGGPFVGWQVQGSVPSVQGALMLAIEAFCGERVKVGGAGRTDAGVHALGQVAHVDLAKDWDADTVRDAVTAHLRPQPVVVLAAEKVPDTFDARFSAIKRHYRYRIVNRRTDLALERGRAWRLSRPLDHAAMHAAAQRLVGRHDFTTFRHVDCQAKSPVKTLDRLDVTREGEELSIAEAVRITGNKPYIFSTDYPHEVDAQTCKHELEELRENTQLTAADKDAILFGNAQRIYQLTLS